MQLEKMFSKFSRIVEETHTKAVPLSPPSPSKKEKLDKNIFRASYHLIVIAYITKIYYYFFSYIKRLNYIYFYHFLFGLYYHYNFYSFLIYSVKRFSSLFPLITVRYKDK